MFPTVQEIKAAAEIELRYMLEWGYDHGEILLTFPRYDTKVTVMIRQGRMEYAKVTQHPKGIHPVIKLINS